MASKTITMILMLTKHYPCSTKMIMKIEWFDMFLDNEYVFQKEFLNIFKTKKYSAIIIKNNKYFYNIKITYNLK